MYRMTPRMLQRFKNDLIEFHYLFSVTQCSEWQQEELIVAAIKSDNQTHHNVIWKEAGHDDKFDIKVRTNGTTHSLQIKSGKIAAGMLSFSGHRLGRFNGDLPAITKYLNANSANIITVPYRQTNDDQGRKHIYKVCYLDVAHLKGLHATKWELHGAVYRQTNKAGVIFSLRPSMSWQVWWKIPTTLLEETPEIVIG